MSSGRKFLASIENVDISRLKPDKLESDVVYPWRVPEKDLAERKMAAESRREDLLQLIYEESLTPEQIEQLIREWISLVAERDKLLHEEIEKENKGVKTGYVRDLRRFLHHMPTLDGSTEEVKLKDALLTLEKHVTEYCHSHNIGSPPSSMPPLHSQSAGLARHGTTPTPTSSLDVPDGPVSKITSLSANSSKPSQQSSGLSTPLHQLAPFGSFSPTQRPPSNDPSLVPPPPPPPPPIIPIGAMGTAQFASAKRPAPLSREVNRKPSKRKPLDPDATRDNKPVRNDDLTKDLMEEITSIGQKNLRHIERPRSPGGTPSKLTRRLTLTSNTDMIQRALISKFRSLHSTPIRQPSTASESSAFDFSNAWSDINSSVDYEDPDITTSNLASDLVNGSDPNASRQSTAV